jgi:hypothetical protein
MSISLSNLLFYLDSLRLNGSEQNDSDSFSFIFKGIDAVLRAGAPRRDHSWVKTIRLKLRDYRSSVNDSLDSLKYSHRCSKGIV